MEAITSLLTAIFFAILLAIFILILLVVTAFFLRRMFKLRRVEEHTRRNIDSKSLAYLLVRFPSQNVHKEDVMSHFLNSIHRVLPSGTHLSLEITSIGKFLYFYIVIDKQHKDLIQSQLYAQYPEIEIDSTSDYWSVKDAHIAMCEMKMKKNSVNPLKTYANMQEHLLKNISAFMMTIDHEEQIYIQIALKRVGSKLWQRGLGYLYYEVMGNKYTKDGKPTEASVKAGGKLYRGTVRVAFKSSSDEKARQRLLTAASFMKQFKSASNELVVKDIVLLNADDRKFAMVQARTFVHEQLWSPDELSTLYHFPYGTGDVFSSTQQHSKKSPAPDIVPRKGQVDEHEATLIGETNFRNEKSIFGVKRVDRRRHMYVVGKTGSGKSRLLELLMMSDIQTNAGLCLIDPHGDLAEQVLKHVPKNRVKDVVYINPSDRDFPVAFNPLEYTQDFEKRQHITFFFISIFKKIFSNDWNERMEHILRFIILALLETKDSNVLGIPRILTDTTYRRYVIGEVKDPAVKAFWANEFSSWNEQYSSQAIVPILNKVGQFVANPIIRNIVGQSRNALDFEKFMNDGKIVIINLSKGKLGEDNAALLGSMFITKIQQATLARASVAEEERRDFYFYIDEFQNFATEAFKSILSESRKYRLNLTIAHQYIDQLSDDIKSSVFGNVGSLVVFSVGGSDAAYLAKEFAPVFTADDMIGLEAREMYLKLSVNGRITKPFSGRTLTTPEPKFDYTLEVEDHTHSKFSENRIVVEREINNWTNAKGVQPVSANGDEAFPEPIV